MNTRRTAVVAAETNDGVRELLTTIHQMVTSELLYLLDGLYTNLEDGLFENFTRHAEGEAHRAAVMQEMLSKRGVLIRRFENEMRAGVASWFQRDRDSQPETEINATARRVSNKSWAHYSRVLKLIAERCARALEVDMKAIDLPVGPYHISRAFVTSCQDFSLSKRDREIINQMFDRHILHRLGAVYGECNQVLKDAGLLTERESVLS